MAFERDEIDRFARTSRFISFDPRVKLACVIAFVVVVSFMRTPAALFISLAFVLSLIAVSKVPLRHIGEYFLVAFPFILFAALALLFTSGWENAYQMGVRISSSVLALTLMISTTPFFDTMRALRWFKVPPLLCNLVMFTYRFIFVLMDEFSRMRLARKARGFEGGRSLRDRTAFKTISNTIGMVFVRANMRAGRIYDALLARGYSGEVRTMTVLKAKGRDAVFVTVFMLVCATMVVLQLEVVSWTL